MGLHLKVRLIATPPNVRHSWKLQLATRTRAYYNAVIQVKKLYCASPRRFSKKVITGYNFIKLFAAVSYTFS
jgi:hypothetical protein